MEYDNKGVYMGKVKIDLPSREYMALLWTEMIDWLAFAEIDYELREWRGSVFYTKFSGLYIVRQNRIFHKI